MKKVRLSWGRSNSNYEKERICDFVENCKNLETIIFPKYDKTDICNFLKGSFCFLKLRTNAIPLVLILCDITIRLSAITSEGEPFVKFHFEVDGLKGMSAFEDPLNSKKPFSPTFSTYDEEEFFNRYSEFDPYSKNSFIRYPTQ